MATVVDELHGFTIAFSSSFFGQITNLSHSGISRAAIPTSHAGTTNAQTFSAGSLYDPGSWQVDGWFDHDADFTTPMTGATETVTITFPLAASGETTAASLTASAFMVDFSWEGPTDGSSGQAATYSATLKIADEITHAAAQA